MAIDIIAHSSLPVVSGESGATSEQKQDNSAIETEEEIGLHREFVSVVGYLESHLIFTGFHVIPVVAFVRPGFNLQPDPKEVAGVFEVPLIHLLDAANHGTRTREVEGGVLHVYNIPYGERTIWGATAGMIMSLYRLLSLPA